MNSLRARLLAAASLVLVIFIGLCGLGLERAFHDSALVAQQERMRGLVYALLGAAVQGDDGSLVLSVDDLPEPRLRQPGSGLEAALLDDSGAVLWQSPSVIKALPVVIGPQVGDWKFERLNGDGSFVLSFGLRWIDEDHRHRRYTALTLEDSLAYETQLGVFRRTLWLSLAAAAIGLLGALLLVQHWGLAPTRRLARELRSVETGAQPQIESPYPYELAPLTSALNAMIRSERSHQQRYRNALADLAHSLKTPLAVLRGLEPPAQAAVFSEQLRRMQQIVDHQLGKAVTAGRRALAEPLHFPRLVARIIAAMRKVYADKHITFENQIAGDRTLRANESDMYDLIGNLADNAAKWCRSRVRIAIGFTPSAVQIAVDDDGAGFPEDADHLLERGVRADSRMPGHGIGLATVAEIVNAYEGTIQLGRSEWGGARVTVTLPT